MNTLPPAAQRFILVTYLAGVGFFVAAWLLPAATDRSHNLWEMLTITALNGLLGWRTMHLGARRDGKHQQEHISLSVSFVLTFLAMLRFGVTGAMLASIAGMISSFASGKPLWFQAAFNIAQGIVQSVVATAIFIALNRGQLHLDLLSTPALIASCLTHYLINTVAVARILTLCTGQPFVKTWRDNFLWVAPSYFIGSAISVLAALLWVWTGTILIILTLLPIVVIGWLGTRQNADRVKELHDSQEKLASMYQATTRSLALAVDAKDHYTHQHILRVQTYAMAISREMGLSELELQAMETGALLHDVGKVGIPDAILLKPGRLTNEEFAEIKRHPVIGAEILEAVPFPYPVIPIVKHHHERWDGTGYPDGLAGEDIPLSARILAVADVYDALTTTRAYRSAWSHEEACNEVQAQAGKHFDVNVVKAFLNIIDEIIVERPFAPPLNPAPIVDERLMNKLEVSTDEPVLVGAK